MEIDKSGIKSLLELSDTLHLTGKLWNGRIERVTFGLHKDENGELWFLTSDKHFRYLTDTIHHLDIFANQYKYCCTVSYEAVVGTFTNIILDDSLTLYDLISTKL